MSNEVGEIAKKLEALIQEIFPDAIKSQDKSDLGFGFGKGYKGLVFVVSPQRTHVNLGVAQGAELQAAFPRLQGSGKVHRHVKIATQEDLANPELRSLMNAALRAARARHKANGPGT